MLCGLRRHSLLVENGKSLWDRFLPLVVHNLNDLVLKVHGYTPSQLLFGITPQRSTWDVTPQWTHITDGLARFYETDPHFNTVAIEEGHVAIRMAAIEEICNRSLDRLQKIYDGIVDKTRTKSR
jgi:hypothetical protein